MRFTSLIVELVRAKARWVFWSVTLAMAALWLVLPSLLYSSPPGDVATVLAIGHEYQVGTVLGPPLSFWLADVAFRLAGGHALGVYLLAQLCFIVTMWAIFELSRAIVGPQQGVLAALLTLTIAAFSYPNLEFGPDTLACPLWALTLLHAWRVMGQGRRGAWFALSIEAGLLFLATAMALPLIVLLVVFVLATRRGRSALHSLDPLFGSLVVIVVALPYFFWLARNGIALPRVSFTQPAIQASQFADLAGRLLLSALGIAVLVIANSRWLNRKPEEAPAIFRSHLDPFARHFVFFFGLLPPLLFTVAAPLFGIHHVLGGHGLALLLVGLVAIVAGNDLIYLRRQHVLRTIWLLAIAAPVVVVLVATLVQPWTEAKEVATALPARMMGKFFDDNYRLRTNRPLPTVAGDPQIATLIGIGAPSRPHVLFGSAFGNTPWIDANSFNASGGLVVWRANDTVGAPPDDVAKRFPGLVAEVPRTFERLVEGRQEPLRVGWGVVRPSAPK